jgi:hypothetical protein
MPLIKYIFAGAVLATVSQAQQTGYGQYKSIHITITLSSLIFCRWWNELDWAYNMCIWMGLYFQQSLLLPVSRSVPSSAMATTTNGQATVTVTTVVTSTIATTIVGCVSGSSSMTGVGGNTASSASTIVTTPPPGTTTTLVGGTSTATLSGNPFAGHQLYANPYYSSEIYSLAIPSLTGTLAVKASAVAQVGTFVWMYASSIEIFKTIATDNHTGTLQLRCLYLIPTWEIFKR